MTDASIVPDQAFRLVCFLVAILVSAWFFSVRKLDSTARTIVALALVVHLIATTVIYFRYGVITNDAKTYYIQAENISAYFSGTVAFPPDLSAGKEGWPTLLGYLSSLLGSSPLIGLWINSVLACGAVAILVRRCSIDFGTTSKIRLLPLSIFCFPMFWMWSVPLLREAAVWFCVALISSCVAGFRRLGRSDPRVVLLLCQLIAAAAFLTWVRASVGLVLAACIGLALLIDRAVGILPKVAAIVAAGLAAPVGVTYFANSSYLDEDMLALSQRELASADSGFSTGAVGELPTNLLRVIFGPFPWELVSLSPVYVLDWIVWIVLISAALICMVRYRAHLYFEMLAVLAMVGSLAWTSGNYGTMVRLRFIVVFLLVFIVAQYFQSRSVERAALDQSEGALP